MHPSFLTWSGRSGLYSPPRRAVRLGLLALFLWSLLAALPLSAQSQQDLRVEVRVVNQGDQERNSAYWLAFDRVLRRHVETRIRIEPDQREALMKKPSLYVQSFRYRGHDSLADGSLLGTRSVREGAAPGAVIAVTFPVDLAAIIQQQLIPVVEEEEQVVETPVLAMIAVEQLDQQFIIGGERGQKFQARAMQLAVANNLQLQFPVIEPADLELINAADIIAGDQARISSFVNQRYQSDKVLTGSLYKLSPTIWQSDWNYSSADGTPQAFSLTTETLDEALVSAMTQISPNGGYLSTTTYDDVGAGVSETSGLALKVENIRSLRDYDNVLAILRQLDADILTESMGADSMVFRTAFQAAAAMRDALIASRNFEPVDAVAYSDLTFRYKP